MQNGKFGIEKPRSSIKLPKRLIKIPWKKSRILQSLIKITQKKSKVFISEFSVLDLVQNEKLRVEKPPKYKIPREKHVCLLSFSNDIGDEKHYSFHCMNPKLVKIHKTFISLVCMKRLPHFRILTLLSQ